MIFLREIDVQRLLTMPDVLRALKSAFAALAEGRAANVPRVRAKGNGFVLHSMSATADYLRMAGWKQYTTTASKAQFLVGLYEQQTGDLIALLEADRLGQMRTGGTTGLAVSCLAPQTVKMGLFGSGWQAESQLSAIAAAVPLETAIVYSRQRDRLDDFCVRMSEDLNLEVRPADDARQAVEGLTLVVTATTSRTPVFDGEWLDPEAMVCAVGSNWLGKAEVDRATVTRCQTVVCDSVEACQAEAGDLVPSLEAGEFSWDRAIELSAIVSQKAARPAGNCLFKSVGLALEDVAVGAAVLDLFHQHQKRRLD